MKGKNIPYDFNSLRRDVMVALPLTKLSGADWSIFILILNQTDAYQRLEDKIEPDFFVERTGLDKANVRRATGRLRKLHMIVKSGSLYSVLPPDQWDKSVCRNRIKFDTVLKLEPGPESVPSIPRTRQRRIKSDTPKRAKLIRPACKSDTLSASLYREHSIENTIENNNDRFGIEAVKSFNKIIKHYFKVYQEQKGEPHPALKAEQRQRVIAELAAFADEKCLSVLKDWKAMIDYHFQRELKTDWNINHFATPGILENLFYKSGLY